MLLYRLFFPQFNKLIHCIKGKHSMFYSVLEKFISIWSEFQTAGFASNCSSLTRLAHNLHLSPAFFLFVFQGHARAIHNFPLTNLFYGGGSIINLVDLIFQNDNNLPWVRSQNENFWVHKTRDCCAHASLFYPRINDFIYS